MYIFYRGKLTDTNFGPGTESLEVELFSEENIPWEELAFPVVKKTLKHYFSDRLTGDYPVRSEDLIKPGDKVWKPL